MVPGPRSWLGHILTLASWVMPLPWASVYPSVAGDEGAVLCRYAPSSSSQSRASDGRQPGPTGCPRGPVRATCGHMKAGVVAPLTAGRASGLDGSRCCEQERTGCAGVESPCARSGRVRVSEPGLAVVGKPLLAVLLSGLARGGVPCGTRDGASDLGLCVVECTRSLTHPLGCWEPPLSSKPWGCRLRMSQGPGLCS